MKQFLNVIDTGIFHRMDDDHQTAIRIAGSVVVIQINIQVVAHIIETMMRKRWIEFSAEGNRIKPGETRQRQAHIPACGFQAAHIKAGIMRADQRIA